MKKLSCIFVLGLLLSGCNSNQVTYQKQKIDYISMYQSTFPKAVKLHRGVSNLSIEGARTLAKRECENYSNKKKISIKRWPCLEHYYASDGSRNWVWDRNFAPYKKKYALLQKREQEEKKDLARKQKFASLDILYGNTCTGNMFKKGFIKGTKEYQNCLFEKEKEAFSQQKILDAKLAAMTPGQRRGYNCEQTFQFRKGTNKFKDCIFKLYTTELELQKLELEKQVALAKLETENAKVKVAASEQARANAVANAQIAAAQAQSAAAKSANLASSLSLMQLGSSMMKSPAPAPSGMGRVRTTCRNVGGFLNCY